MFAARHVPLPEHLPAEVILTHDRQAAAVPAADLSRDGGLPRRGIAADHDQPGAPRGIAFDARREACFGHLALVFISRLE